MLIDEKLSHSFIDTIAIFVQKLSLIISTIGVLVKRKITGKSPNSLNFSYSYRNNGNTDDDVKDKNIKKGLKIIYFYREVGVHELK